MLRLKTLVLLLALLFIAQGCNKFTGLPGDEDEEDVVGPEDDKTDDSKGDPDKEEMPDTVSVTVFRTVELNYSVHVRGYIVGAATGQYNKFRYDFTPPFQYDTAILLSDTPVADSKDDVISVCIRTGPGSPREKLNLVDNPGNLGRMLVVYGMQTRYIGLPGINKLDAWGFVGD